MSEQPPQPQNFESYFAEQPVALEKYVPGEPVTRVRFVDMLITSFNYSRGDSIRQVLYLSWVEARSGFLWEPALKTFIDTEGWDTLTETEHIHFLNRFMAVKAHEFSPEKEDEQERWRGMLERPAQEVATQIEGLYTTIQQNPHLTKDFQRRYKQFSEILSERELGRALDHFYPPYRLPARQNDPEQLSLGTRTAPWYTSLIRRLLAAIRNP